MKKLDTSNPLHVTPPSQTFQVIQHRQGLLQAMNIIVANVNKKEATTTYAMFHQSPFPKLVYHFRIRFIISGHTDAPGLIRWEIYYKSSTTSNFPPIPHLVPLLQSSCPGPAPMPKKKVSHAH